MISEMQAERVREALAQLEHAASLMGKLRADIRLPDDEFGRLAKAMLKLNYYAHHLTGLYR